MDDQAKDLQKELKEVDQALRLDPTNVDLMAQRQQILSQTISVTSERLGVLRQAQAQVEQQFANGDIGADQYRAFQRELSNTEAQLNSLSNEVTSSQANQERLIQSTRDFNTLLGATGTELNDYVDLLGSRLTSAIQNGTASADQINRAIRLVGQQAIGSSASLQDLQQAIRHIDDGASFDDVANDLRNLGSVAEDAGDEIEGLGGKLKGVAAVGVGAMATLGVAIKEGLDMSRLDTQIEMSLSLNEEDTAVVKESIREVSAALGDEELAYEGVRRQMSLNRDASVSTNQEIIKGASSIAFAYKEIDFNELIQESHEMAKTFGISQQEALGMTQALLKIGFPPEQLDIIAEYGNQLIEAGYTAQEIQAIMAAGVETGTWNIDILLDGIKEGRIVMAEFGAEVDQSMKDVLKGTNISAEQMQVWGQAVAEGGYEGTDAMQAVAYAIQEIDDKTKQNEVGVKVFGTLWEENGTKITDTLINMNEHLSTNEDNMLSFSESIQAMDSDPLNRINQAINDVKTALEPTLLVMAEFAGKVADMVSALLDGGESTNEFATAVQETFDSIKEFVIPIIDEVVGFVKDELSALKEYWDENGAQLQETIETVWNAIKAVFEVVLPIIVGIITDAWDNIKGIISGALDIIMGLVKAFSGLLSGDFSKMWEGIKQIWDGAVEFIFNLVQLWILGKVVGVFKKFGTEVKKFVSDAVDTVKKKFDEIVSKIKDVFKIDDFVKIGKDVIDGLVKGFVDFALKPVKAIEKIGKDIIGAANRVFDRHSPSRVFRAIGNDVILGMNLGMQDQQSGVLKTMDDIGNSLIDVADHYAQEERKIMEESNQKIKDIEEKAAADIAKIKESSSKKNQKSASDNAKKIAKIEEDSAKKILEIQKKATVDANKLTGAQRKAELDEITNFISERNSLNQMGVLEEIAIWKTASEYFEEGSKERIKSQQNYKKAVEAVNKEVLSTNDKFTKEMNKITEDFTKESAKLWDQYYKELDAITKKLVSSMGGLTSIFKETEISGQDMIAAQQSQVDAMIQWRATMEGLYSRIDNDDLIKELEEMGVKGLGEVKALNSLSDAELQNFVTLYEDKFRLAREQAESQLAGSKKDVEKNIKAMKRTADDELEILQDSWNKSIRSITKSTDNELKTLQQVGVDAGNALLNGLSSTEGALNEKAKQIAESIKNTMSSVLGVDAETGNASSTTSAFGSIGGALSSTMSSVRNSLSSTRSSGNALSRSASISNNVDVQVQSAPIYLDGKLIAEATFNTVNNMTYNQAAIKGRVRGLTMA
ncbi:hypothetical protein ACIQZG_04525 [Lysinibacillus sp. NPDC096418]|uniref:hypothetical protein n=1 Tax=Lysinibacillus sp. NPDC096418 TaxID=3364138 RepID=UPI0037F4ED41